jgi:hypothetical protein
MNPLDLTQTDPLPAAGPDTFGGAVAALFV